MSKGGLLVSVLKSGLLVSVLKGGLLVSVLKGGLLVSVSKGGLLVSVLKGGLLVVKSRSVMKVAVFDEAGLWKELVCGEGCHLVCDEVKSVFEGQSVLRVADFG